MLRADLNKSLIIHFGWPLQLDERGSTYHTLNYLAKVAAAVVNNGRGPVVHAEADERLVFSSKVPFWCTMSCWQCSGLRYVLFGAWCCVFSLELDANQGRYLMQLHTGRNQPAGPLQQSFLLARRSSKRAQKSQIPRHPPIQFGAGASVGELSTAQFLLNLPNWGSRHGGQGTPHRSSAAPF